MMIHGHRTGSTGQPEACVPRFIVALRRPIAYHPGSPSATDSPAGFVFMLLHSPARSLVFRRWTASCRPRIAKSRLFFPPVAVATWCFSFVVAGDLTNSVAPPWYAAIEDTGVIDFTNDVIPILTKAGCNAGACHAKAGGGQNGFELSLLGFEPDLDFDRIVSQARGRRIFPAAPEESLLLRKATGGVPHTGGVRIGVGSPEYQLLAEWIRGGALPRVGLRSGQSDEPSTISSELVDVLVQPELQRMQPGQSQQLTVIAIYSDGGTRDVTALALYESNNPAIATVSDTGVVTAAEMPGSAAIMVRYQGRIPVFRPSVPLGPELTNLVPGENVVDQHVFANLARLGIPPSVRCDDATFLRRATIDMVGRLPTETERQRYWAAPDQQRRIMLVDALLLDPDYAEYFANKWTGLLKNRRDNSNDLAANFAFHAWVRDHLQAGTGYDQIVKQLLAATGTVRSNPPVAWYKRVTDPKQQIEDLSQLFLGVRLQCAQCHHHPFERWSQDDYYALVACFSQVGRKPTGVRNEDMIFHQRGVAEATNVRSGQTLRPRALGTGLGEIDPSEDPRLRLADWMRTPDNPYFAPALVNRYWKHFFHVGLIEPEDDIRDTNPPSNPELLQALASQFIASGFDLRGLVRTLVLSDAYQLSSEPNSHNRVDTQNFSRFYPRRLTAEVLLDAIDQLLVTQTSFANLPVGTRAISLPDNSYNRSVAFLKVFGRPDNSSVCECERVQTGNLAQSLHLLNAADLKTKLAARGGLAEQLANAQESLADRIERIYETAFCRSVQSEERDAAEAFMTQPTATKTDFEDLLWAIINTKEFLFNH